MSSPQEEKRGSAFRPSRPRASIATVPTSGLSFGNKENLGVTTDSPAKGTRSKTSKKRAHSLGGEALEEAFKQQTAASNEDGLSPRKRLRRSLVPGRSILKTAANTSEEHTQTLNFSAMETAVAAEGPPPPAPAPRAPSDNCSDDDDDEDEIALADDRRKSLARRVSFAPTAHVRTFDTTPSRRRSSMRQSSAYLPDSPSSSESEDQSMEMTAAVGQIFGGAQEFDADEDEEGTEMDEDEEMDDTAEQSVTMEMTAAIGHILGEQQQEQEQEQEEQAQENDETAEMDITGHSMEMTTAFGGIVQDEQHSDDDVSQHDESVDQSMGGDTMDMEDATSYGAILPSDATGVPTPSTPSSRLRASLTAVQNAQKEGTPARYLDNMSPRRASLPRGATPERRASRAPTPELSGSPAAGTPNSASPLSARKSTPSRTPSRTTSAQKARRESSVPGSPRRSPRKSEAAMTPGTSRSPGGSLSLAGLLKQGRSPSIGNVFRPPSSLAKISSPLKQVAFGGPTSPLRRSPSRQSMDFGNESSILEEGPSALRINEFLREAKIVFDEASLALAGVDLKSKGRKSLAAARHDVTYEPSGPPAFADIIVAGACKRLFYDLYSDERTLIQHELLELEATLAQMDANVEREQPGLFQEWCSASEGRKAELSSQFRMIKSFYYAKQRTQWNNFRAANYEMIVNAMEGSLDGLIRDTEFVTSEDLGATISSLETRKAELMKELHEERARDVELSACDQDQLESIREAVREQAAQVNEYKQEHAEVTGQLKRLTSKADELGAQRSTVVEQVSKLEKTLEEGRCHTRTEVFRLKGDFEGLQHLHDWTITRFDASSVNLVFGNEVAVHFQLAQGHAKAVTLTFVDTLGKDSLKREMSQYLFAVMKHAVEQETQKALASQPLSASAITTKVSSIWTCVQRLRTEFALARLHFPVTSQVMARGGHPFLRNTVSVHAPQARASFNVVFDIAGEEILKGNPDAIIEDLSCDVQSVWGDIDHKTLEYVVRERVNTGGRRAILEACDEAEAKCDD